MHGDEESGATTPTLAERYRQVRTLTEELAAPLSPEDQTVQSMSGASPTKWHRAHTTLFFEEFVLVPRRDSYQPYDPGYRSLFSSYDEAVGPRRRRSARGLITRPSSAEVGTYRAHVDAEVAELLRWDLPESDALLIELGLHHEQQHQERLLMDIKHALFSNVLDPVYRPNAESIGWAPELQWVDHPGGKRKVGWSGEGFAFDNESPAHAVWLEPFQIASRTVTNGEVQAFVADGGYRRSELWLSDGWATVQSEGWSAPLYWQAEGDGSWSHFTLSGRRILDPDQPACHLSYYEADAIARWSDARLPTEAEWEVVARACASEQRVLDLAVLHPRSARGDAIVSQLVGDVWEWTASAYLPYPGFRPALGAVGEYNGKFMVNQHVLRGGSFATPAGHIRHTYRNFFAPATRWAFSGVRLARS